MATASMANRNGRQQQQGSSGAAKFKPSNNTATNNTNPPPHHREQSNDRQEKYSPTVEMTVDLRTSWARKSTNASGTATLVNRATTPSSTRTNSPTPAANAWTNKADERTAHDAFT